MALKRKGSKALKTRPRKHAGPIGPLGGMRKGHSQPAAGGHSGSCAVAPRPAAGRASVLATDTHRLRGENPPQRRSCGGCPAFWVQTPVLCHRCRVSGANFPEHGVIVAHVHFCSRKSFPLGFGKTVRRKARSIPGPRSLPRCPASFGERNRTAGIGYAALR